MWCKVAQISEVAGANACIIQNVTIGRATFVAAGATVVSSWGADLLVGGTPARLLK
jgi:acetyltransferase-like isoleucine patch superfamily enzyme